ncbi:Susd and RagB outer membrane lipoprotein [Filimonas lacunae]|uniref:Susd and RagB outer membrane lipoprotein n=1 Tax=Filimonas lacunae TaxID=477680 RepID=A0A173MJG6_9BACT|nr:SusD/RagB family nutrient-binding outer membrane lipoprotein [Filimonas lacunae]BAV07627.1 hypothetical protein FLA_3653 [Filimonas lacunae]SIT29747.1 Susd and RagB outer membrane lipoprotein [Filimonas lacunae]
MRNNVYIPVILIATTLLFASCTKKFEEYNTGLSGLSDEILNADFTRVVGPMREVQKNLINQTSWIYQLQQNLNADIYSGYFMSPTTYGGDNNTNYYMKDGWNERVMVNQLDDGIQKIVNFEAGTLIYPEVAFNHCRGILNILKVIIVHKVSDVHGPVIYTHYGKPNADLSVDYDSQQDAYTALFKTLDSAQLYLSKTDTSDLKALRTADMVYKGDITKWKKLANTLRLRLAIRIKYADGAKAKLEGEKALDPANGGLIEDNADNALINYGAGHPINIIIYSWGDCRSGAPLCSILNGYNDPRLTHYMLPATDAAVQGQYIGIRNGINLLNNDRYRSYSQPTAKAAVGDYFDANNGMAKLVTAAETWFLKAEAALEGWTNAGDAQTNYETGIDKSFQEWSAGPSATYITNSTLTAQPYIDPKSVVPGENDIKDTSRYLSKVTIRWDEANSIEGKLEKIITQKWIALYPDGQEAWSEFRRTGYPKLFPVVINQSGGTISTTDFIRRLPICNKFRDSDPAGYGRAAATLGGPDVGGTKLWWDKKP